MADERYRPGYMNNDEYNREQARQKDMVESIAREYSRAEKEKILERLSQVLEILEMITQVLLEISETLKNSSSLKPHG